MNCYSPQHFPLSVFTSVCRYPSLVEAKQPKICSQINFCYLDMNTYHLGALHKENTKRWDFSLCSQYTTFSLFLFWLSGAQVFKFFIINSQLFPKPDSATKSKSKTKPLYWYQHRKGKLINCISSGPLQTTLLTKVIYPFHEEKAKLHRGRDKVNRATIHLRGLPTWYRICASILYYKIGRSGFLTMKNVTALLSSVNIYNNEKFCYSYHPDSSRILV